MYVHTYVHLSVVCTYVHSVFGVPSVHTWFLVNSFGVLLYISVQDIMSPTVTMHTYTHTHTCKLPYSCPLPTSLLLQTGLTPIHIATQEASLDVLKFLFTKEANKNAIDTTSGRTALHYAVEQENVRLVSFLIQEGCDTNAATYSGTAHLELQGCPQCIVSLECCMNLFTLLHKHFTFQTEQSPLSLVPGFYCSAPPC